MQENEFDRADLAEAIAARIVVQDQDGLQQKHTTEDIIDVLRAFASCLSDALVEHQRVEIHELGVFRLQPKDADSGNTPDGVAWSTPPRNKVDFDAAPFVCRIVSERTGIPAY